MTSHSRILKLAGRSDLLGIVPCEITKRHPAYVNEGEEEKSATRRCEAAEEGKECPGSGIGKMCAATLARCKKI